MKAKRATRGRNAADSTQKGTPAPGRGRREVGAGGTNREGPNPPRLAPSQVGALAILWSRRHWFPPRDRHEAEEALLA